MALTRFASRLSPSSSKLLISSTMLSSVLKLSRISSTYCRYSGATSLEMVPPWKHSSTVETFCWEVAEKMEQIRATITMMGERMATSTQPIFFRVLSSVRARMAALIAATAAVLIGACPPWRGRLAGGRFAVSPSMRSVPPWPPRTPRFWGIFLPMSDTDPDRFPGPIGALRCQPIFD